MRRLILVASVVASLLAAPLVAGAEQAGKRYRIGHIAPPDFDRPDHVDQRFWASFVQGLSDLGWVEGKNILFERRLVSDYGRPQQQAAEDFARMGVDVIVLVGGGRAQAVHKITGSIPIVTLSSGELVASGVVASLARPGGSITGMQNYSPELMGKRVQILKELIPTLSRLVVLRRGAWHSGILAAYRESTAVAARQLGITVRYVWFQDPGELPGLFGDMVKERDGAVLVWAEPGISPLALQILELALRHRLPVMGENAAWATSGALVAYGPKYDDVYRQAATYVDRILKGAKPGDLPIGQPATFELVFNAKTAEALRLAIPPSLLARADRTIR